MTQIEEDKRPFPSKLINNEIFDKISQYENKISEF
jgi:hypothetical protein